jgi:adenosylcobyric acid synthase
MWREHGLPEEDGVFDSAASGSGLSVAVVAYPCISNLDEFAPLTKVPGLSLSWARRPQTIASADLLVLPGSKNVAGDLAWLRQCGLDAAIAAHISADKPTLAVCGGLQILGGEIRDPHGVEGQGVGLGLLPYATEFQRLKRCRHGSHTLGPLSGFWAPLSGLTFEAYEIRHGHSFPTLAPPTLPPGPVPAMGLRSVLAENGGWQQGQVLALYLHGLFESPRVMHALFGSATPTLDDTLDGLADFVDAHFAEGALMSLLE